MMIKQASDLTENDTTPYALYQNRREFLRFLGGLQYGALRYPHWLGQSQRFPLMKPQPILRTSQRIIISMNSVQAKMNLLSMPKP